MNGPIRTKKWWDCMQASARRFVLIILGTAVACMGVSAASGQPHKKHPTVKQRGANGASVHRPGGRGSRAKRSSRNAAAQEAARLGTAVGQACNGRASMQRDDQRWVVLCSNGKTYLVGVPQTPGAPAVECSLAGNGPFPGCFR
jgi:hypothetical protein